MDSRRRTNTVTGIETVTRGPGAVSSKPRSKFALLQSKGFTSQGMTQKINNHSVIVCKSHPVKANNHSVYSAGDTQLEYPVSSKKVYCETNVRMPPVPGLYKPNVSEILASSLLQRLRLGFKHPWQHKRGKIPLSATEEASEEEEEYAVMADDLPLIAGKDKKSKGRIVIRRIRKLLSTLLKPNKTN